jgi:hypothetical protein
MKSQTSALRQHFDSAGLVAAEVVEAVAGRVDELNVKFFWRDVDVVEAEVMIGDKATARVLQWVERR